MSCGVGHRCGSDPALLWLWRRLAAAAPIRALAWEPPHAVGAAQEMVKKQRQGSSHRGAAEMNPTWNYEVAGSIPGLCQWVKDAALP